MLLNDDHEFLTQEPTTIVVNIKNDNIMSTRGCIVKLNREKCEIDYIHYGLDFVVKLFYESTGNITSPEMQDLLIKETELCPWHIDITDKDLINRLFRYDTDVIEMDSELFLFCEDKGHRLDLTLRWRNYKEFMRADN